MMNVSVHDTKYTTNH